MSTPGLVLRTCLLFKLKRHLVLEVINESVRYHAICVILDGLLTLQHPQLSILLGRTASGDNKIFTEQARYAVCQ